MADETGTGGMGDMADMGDESANPSFSDIQGENVNPGDMTGTEVKE